MIKGHKIYIYWWIPALIIFDFIYYYLVKHIESGGNQEVGIQIQWEALVFIFMISLLSLGCVYFVIKRLEKFSIHSISLRYVQILFYSFILFILITAGGQFILEYLWGQERSLAYIIGNALIFIFLHIVVGNTYIGISYLRESANLKEDLLRADKVRIESELKILQQQLNPHFLFNNLNTLASIIPQDTEKATRFTFDLSALLRYITQNSQKDLVPLEEECHLLKVYMALIEVRFGAAYQLTYLPKSYWIDSLYVIPNSLQIIIENVIKHNSGSREVPLEITINIEENNLIIENEIRQKVLSPEEKSGIGLQNLNDRYQLIYGKKVEYFKENGRFIVKLPIIKLAGNESINH